MFGIFKKKSEGPPPLPTGPDRLRVGFATLGISNLLSIARGLFCQEVIGGVGKRFLEFTWGKFCARNLHQGAQVPAFEVTATAMKQGDRIIGSMVFPDGGIAGEPLFGVMVFGPCSDPAWSKEACETVPVRYFVLFRTADGTAIEEWTTGAAIPRGIGPEAEEFAFIERVIQAVFGVVRVPTGDEEMKCAIERARKELPSVLARFVSGELNDCLFTVKVAVREQNVVEHVWLSVTTFDGNQFSGILDSDLKDLKQVSKGDRITAGMEDVTDWGYVRDGKMFGNYTLRVLLPHMSPEVAEKYRAAFAEA